MIRCNLLAVAGEANQQKSDSGPSTWLPPASGYTCDYLVLFVTIVDTYDLSIDEDDRTASRRILSAC